VPLFPGSCRSCRVWLVNLVRLLWAFGPI